MGFSDKVGQSHPLKNSALLSIGGLDGTGGAGVHCDIKICSFLRIPNITVVTSLVIQSPHEVFQLEQISSQCIKTQIQCLSESYNIPVVNVGLVGSAEMLSFISTKIKGASIIFDPLFHSGSGKFIFKTESQIQQIAGRLRNIFLITPNIPEASTLARLKISSLDMMKEAARKIQNRHSIPNVLIKGGHLQKKRSVDLLLHGDNFFTFESDHTGYNIHGTGSFLNAAISAYVFKQVPLPLGVQKAKKLLSKSITRVQKEYPMLEL